MVDSNNLPFEATEKVGNPWTILPIKNKKYAKDLTEVHLSDRKLSALENFDAFPNLEVIWLSRNKVSSYNQNSTSLTLSLILNQS